MNDVGKHIKTLRKENRVSQETLADSLYVTRQAVSQWETGRTQPDLDTLEIIAKYFNVDILTIIYGKKQKSHIDEHIKKMHTRNMILFSLLAAVIAVIYLCFKPHFQRMSSIHFDFSYVIFFMSVRPLIYLFASIAALHGASLLWHIQIESKTAKRPLLIASTIILCLHYIVPLLCTSSSFVNGFLFHFAYTMASLPVLFFLPGIGLFFGTQKAIPPHSQNRS